MECHVCQFLYQRGSCHFLGQGHMDRLVVEQWKVVTPNNTKS